MPQFSAEGRLEVDATVPLFEHETVAEQFLSDLKDSIGNDDEAGHVIRAFVQLHKDMHAGKRTLNATRQAVANLLADEAPTMIEEFTEVFDRCKGTNAWAGFERHATAPLDTPGAFGAQQPPPAGGRRPRRPMSLRLESMPAGSMDMTAFTERSAVPSVGAGGEGKPRDWVSWSKKLVPEGRGSYVIWFTIGNIALIAGLFAYMAGDYVAWIDNNSGLFKSVGFTDQEEAAILATRDKVPEYVKLWLQWNPAWRTFSFDFLRNWGGRFAPFLKSGNWWLWFTSIYVHQNLQHITSNLLLFVAMSVLLELNYGWWRMTLVWIMSGVGANLISAAFEDVCTLLVGASGAVFGFMGLFVADLVMNFESMSWPFVRVIIILVFVVFFVANALIDTSGDASTSNVSHASHIGGLVCGMFPSMLFLPNLRDKRLRAVQRQIQEDIERKDAQDRDAEQHRLQAELAKSMRASFWSRNFIVNPLIVLAVLVLIAVYVVLPVYLYTNKFQSVDLDNCPGSTPPPIGDPAGDPVADGDGIGRRLLANSDMPVVKWG